MPHAFLLQLRHFSSSYYNWYETTINGPISQEVYVYAGGTVEYSDWHAIYIYTKKVLIYVPKTYNSEVVILLK